MAKPAVDVLNIPLVDPKDPWDDLIERTENHPGAPLDPEILARIFALKKEEPAKFEDLRSRLKKAGCRVTALDKALQEHGALRAIGGRFKVSYNTDPSWKP